MDSRRNPASLLLAGTVLLVVFVRGAMLCLPQNGLFIFVYIGIPVLYTAMTFALGALTHTPKWWVLGRARWQTWITYIGICVGVMLVARPLGAYTVCRVFPLLPASSRLVILQWPWSLQATRCIIGASVPEELLFRGWMMSWLDSQDLAPVQFAGHSLDPANLLASLSFAVLHLVNGMSIRCLLNVFLVFFVSLLLGRARKESGGILLPTLCHATINFMNYAWFAFVPA